MVRVPLANQECQEKIEPLELGEDWGGEGAVSWEAVRGENSHHVAFLVEGPKSSTCITVLALPLSSLEHC